MTEYVDRVTLPQRLSAAAAMATAGSELALVVMALYGVIAFAASQRRREIGLRLALGASNRSVIVLMMREGLLLTAAGVVLGVGVALIGGAALRSLLIGIEPADPVSFGGAVLMLLIVGAAASYVPARRAASVDQALHCEANSARSRRALPAGWLSLATVSSAKWAGDVAANRYEEPRGVSLSIMKTLFFLARLGLLVGGSIQLWSSAAFRRQGISWRGAAVGGTASVVYGALVLAGICQAGPR